MNVLYVTDFAGREMLITSLLSLAKHHPDASVYVCFTCDPFELPPPFEYNIVELSEEQRAWTSQYPEMNRVDGRFAPRTTFFKIASLYSLPEHVDEVLYLDIDTLIIADISDIFSKFKGGIAGCHSLGSLRADQPFNAGVLPFRRSKLPKDFDKLYHEEVIKSKGKYGDQEVFKRTRIKPEYISPIYNSRKKFPATRILHLAGIKPFQAHTTAVTCTDEFLQEYWKTKEAMDNVQTGLGKGNSSADKIYIDFYRRALLWLENTVEGYRRKTQVCQPRAPGTICRCGSKH